MLPVPREHFGQKMKKIIIIILVAVLLLASCSPSPKDSRTVLKIGDKKINYDYFRYVWMNTRDDLSGGDEIVVQNDYALQMELNDSVLNTLLRNCAIEKVAEKYNISLSKDEKRTIKAWINDQKAAFGDDYEKSLSDCYMNEYLLWYLQCFNSLWSKTYDYVTDITNGIIPCTDELIMDSVRNEFFCIKYIMISDETENARSLADEVRRLCTKRDFEDLISEYNTDDNMKSKIDCGYYFIKGEMIEDIESTVSDMEIGEISPIIDTDSGYFIIRRYKIDERYISENMGDMEEKYLAGRFNEMVEKMIDELEVEYTKLYGKLNVYTMK